MKLEKIDSKEYLQLFGKSYIPYNSVEFNLLHAHKCERIEFFLFHEENNKLGLIAGIKANALYSPFSAPFSSYSFRDSKIKICYINGAISALEEYTINTHLSSINYALPPYFYDEYFISKMIFCLNRNEYSAFVSINHCYHTKDFLKYENDQMEKDIRYKIRTALKAGLVFKRESSIDGYRIAYDVICQNKVAKNRTQGLTFNQILDLTKFIKIDFFVVYHKDNPIASSIVYNNTPSIVQIIYWGNLPDFNSFYPMNFLAMNIFQYYREQEIDIIDLGTSMTDRDVNPGLCKFKESIGATTSLKFSFVKELRNN